jgi:S-adenosylmethionine hydrolase
MTRITLLTDFGTEDGFVGAIKGVLATLAPEALVEDISHRIPRGGVRKAALALERYWRRYPPGTVHLVVVDPGVGTERRGLSLRVDRRFFVGPDNGVFSRVLEGAAEREVVELAASELLPDASSDTFHGRDWFAPASALLATGTPLEALGNPIRDPVLLPSIPPTREGNLWIGQVVDVDRFGNLATNLPAEIARSSGEVGIGEVWVGFRKTYGVAAPGALLALVNSDGRVEVAVRDGSAAARLGVGVGDEVRVRVSDSPPKRGTDLG